MLVGINHPWIKCGHDFGARPPAWGGERAQRDFGEVERELRQWRELGVRVSRFWLLGGGVNYPVGQDPRALLGVEPLPTPTRLRAALRRHLLVTRRGHRHERFVLRGAELPALPQRFGDDFRALLQACERAQVKLLPSLVSFEFFHPIEEQTGGVCSRGRAALVFGDDPGRADPEQVDRFLDATLEPLLEISQEARSAIYAWEVANEPDWVVEGGPMHARLHGRRVSIMPKTVRADAMALFLERAVDRITRAGFVASIGTKLGHSAWLPRATVHKLSRLGREGRYLHQLHHYPSPYEPWRLPEHARLPIRPCLVGEFPTARGKPLGLHQWCWPEGISHYAAELDPARYLEARLRLIEAKGYPGALLWGGRSQDGMSAWGDAQRAQVARYTSSSHA